jgi:hypothetical protein
MPIVDCIRTFRAVSGDLFTSASYPREADAVSLGSVLHDWSDDKCLEMEGMIDNCS